MDIKLIILDQGQKTERSFKCEVISIGRGAENDIRLADPKVSRRHCRIEILGESAFLVDQASQNGTLLNGEATARHLLKAGDCIEMGSAKIFFEQLPDSEKNGTEQALADAKENLSERTLIREGRKERDNLLVLHKINQAINSQTKLRTLLDLIVDSAIALSHAERGFLILGREEKISFEVARNFAREPIEIPELRVSRSITARVRESGKPLLSLNASEDERFREFASVHDLQLLSVICLPLRIRGEIEGVLYVDNRLQEGSFSREDLQLLEALCEQASIAIDNAKKITELEEVNQKLQSQTKEIELLNAQLSGELEKSGLELESVRTVLSQEQGRKRFPKIVGESEAMKALFKSLERVLPNDFPVLIEGESGTGKELIARAIHANSPRKEKPFVSENCAAISDSLLESELFGHVRGAFTGAHRPRRGLVEAAHGGTLFLDEVGEMSDGMQKKLLRFLQEGEFRPVGSDRVVKSELRVLAASNRKLSDLVREGKFREDLYYRLNVLHLEIPPLRHRKEDLPLLVDHFLSLWAKELGQTKKKISADFLRALERYSWPGNIRELENELRKCLVLDGNPLNADSISSTVRQGSFQSFAEEADTSTGGLPAKIAKLEMKSIQAALEQAHGNKSAAAEILGITRFSLQRRMEKLGLGVSADE